MIGGGGHGGKMHGLRGFKIKVRINVWMFLIIFIVNKNIKESSRAVLFYVFKDLEKKIKVGY